MAESKKARGGTLAPGRPSAAEEILHSAEAEGRTVLLEHEVYALLAESGVEVPRHRLVGSPEAAFGSVCAALGSEEAVVKIASPDLLHKSDVGGVVVCRNEPGPVREAVARVLAAGRAAAPGARLDGALVAERIRFRAGTGREVLAAFRHDPAFGAVVVLGVGGLDTAALLGALRPERARTMLAARGLTESRSIHRP